MIIALRERGFEVIKYSDPIEFRYTYETFYRSKWDSGQKTDLVVVLSTDRPDIAELPYDLLQAGRKLSFSLAEIFPNLSYPVIASLDHADLDILYNALQVQKPGLLGDYATIDFVLQAVFGIAVELIQQDIDLLRILLRKHLGAHGMPGIVEQRLIALLRQKPAFSSWPLEILIPDRNAFYAFLQERWSVYLDHAARQQNSALGSNAHDKKPPPYCTYPDPRLLPFDHPEIRAYIEQLFAEGQLFAVAHENAEYFANSWVSIGIQGVQRENRRLRFQKLANSLVTALEKDNSYHESWFQIAYEWAEMKHIAYDEIEHEEEYLKKLSELASPLDDRFHAWIRRRYASLIQLPPSPPVMLHHIPRHLARKLDAVGGSRRLALIVIDGLALDQWMVLKQHLNRASACMRFNERAVFAWIPSITSVSRQSLFAAKPPIYFPNSIATTAKENLLWQQFWESQRFSRQEIAYFYDTEGPELDFLNEKIKGAGPRMILGLVIGKLDRIMHGMELGTAGMHISLAQWLRQGYLKNLLDLLLDAGFQVYLTSDHGNIEAQGCGSPQEGALADIRESRVRIYPDPDLRHRIGQQFTGTEEWQPVGLPESFWPLLAPQRKAFIPEKRTIVCHGGISMEELIVPFISIERTGT
jgi:hypothetical protein